MSIPNLFRVNESVEHRWRAQHERGLRVMHTWHSGDARFMECQKAVQQMLVEAFPESESVNGFLQHPYVGTDWAGLDTIAGFYARPLTLVPVDNRLLRESLGLDEPEWDSAQGRRNYLIYSTLAEVMVEEYEASDVRVPKHSSSGFPFFSKNWKEKVAILEHCLQHFWVIITMVCQGKLEELFRTLNGFIVAYMNNLRVQAESGKKARGFNDADYALYGKGKPGVQDKQAVADNGVVKDGFAGRSRTVFGLSWCANGLIKVVFTGIRASYLSRFPETWKHKGPEDIARKVKDWKYVRGFDASNYDQSVPWQIVEVFFSRCKDVMDSRYVDFVRHAYYSAYFQPPVNSVVEGGKRKYGPFGWIGNPLKKIIFGQDGEPQEGAVNSGLKSGIDIVSDIGKFGMVGQYLILADSFYGNVLEIAEDPKASIRAYLKHKAAFADLNAGDDDVHMFNDDAYCAFLDGIFDSEVSGSEDPVKPANLRLYFKITYEKYAKFLGNVLVENNLGEKKCLPQLGSMIINLLCPERGQGSHFKKYPGHGWEARKKFYAAHPLSTEVMGRINELFVAYLGQTIDTFMQQLKAEETFKMEQERIDSGAVTSFYDRWPDLNYDELTVLLDNNKYHYAVDVAQIRPEIADELAASVEYIKVRNVVREAYAGIINEANYTRAKLEEIAINAPTVMSADDSEMEIY